MIAKTVALLTLLSVTMLVGNAYAESGASIIDNKLSGNIGSLTGNGNVSIVISNPNGDTTDLSVLHTDSGYFETPVSFTETGNYIITVSYEGTVISTIPYVVVNVITPPVYETTTDGVINVEVFTIPFDVTITENGKVTVHNNDSIDRIVSHTGTIGTGIGGTFYKVIPSGNARTIDFPITGSSIYPAGVYSFVDTVSGKVGTITIEKWGGSNEAVTETTITGVTQGIVEEVGIQENVVVIVTHGDSTQTVVTTDTPIDEYTMTSLHLELVYVNNKLNKSLESVGLLQNELDLSLDVITTQQQKIVSLEKTIESSVSQDQVLKLESTVTVLETQINTLEVEKTIISKERDEWKTLSDQWYAVAVEQVRVMVNVLGL